MTSIAIVDDHRVVSRSLKAYLEAFPDLEEDVRQSIARIQASPFIPNKSSVRGFVYDVKSGKLGEVKTPVAVR